MKISKPVLVKFYTKDNKKVTFKGYKTGKKRKVHPYLEKCPECGQSVTLDYWIKRMKKAGFPSLAKLLSYTKPR